MRPATAAIGRENEPTQIVSFGLNADVETTMQRKFDDGGRHGLPYEPLDAAASRGQCQQCLLSSQHSPNESERQRLTALVLALGCVARLVVVTFKARLRANPEFPLLPGGQKFALQDVECLAFREADIFGNGRAAPQDVGSEIVGLVVHGRYLTGLRRQSVAAFLVCAPTDAKLKNLRRFDGSATPKPLRSRLMACRDARQ